MADISSTFGSLNSTESNAANGPSGSTAIGSGLDENLRLGMAHIAAWRDQTAWGILTLTSISGTNTVTATLATAGSVTFGPTALAAGMKFLFTPAANNTSAVTLNITSPAGGSALGAKNIFKNGVALVGGELQQNCPVVVEYDGTQFQLISSAAQPAIRSYLAGLGMASGGSTTITASVGSCADSTNALMMSLSSATAKTTGAWSVGGGVGALDASTVANSTWYHWYVIQRPDTNVVDLLFSKSATAPTLPTSYVYFRRIGSAKTDGSGNWTAFTQDGDLFTWSSPPTLDVNQTAAGNLATTRTLTVPTGVNVLAQMNVELVSSTSNDIVYLSDLSNADVAPSATATPLGQVGALNATANNQVMGQVVVRTNTSAQIRSRQLNGGGSDILRIATTGWYDRRGRDS